MTSLINYMMKDHKKIENLYDNFIWNLGKKGQLDAFNTFKWEMMRHFGIEEKIVFTQFNPKTQEDIKMLSDTIDEHKQMMLMLDAFEKSLKSDDDVNVEEFEAFMNKHKVFEDDYLYPKLEQALDEIAKQHIIERLKVAIND